MSGAATRTERRCSGVTPTFHDVAEDDGKALAAMARQAFDDTFRSIFPPAALQTHLDRAYGPDGLVAEIGRSGTEFRCAKVDIKIVGYAKLRPFVHPAGQAEPGALELQQIYVLSPWHGAGIAPELMEWAIERARERGAPELYLTVFDHNERAKRFYTRYGFADVGLCWFELGGRTYEDRIWRRDL
jgi:diamine N-acetyltransferase